jgi:DNA polymerase-3 subunit gamma/tau
MEKYIVSARKYRPVTFDTVVGQPSITTTLKNAIRTNHIAQAYLFTGPRGVGKTTTARILAKTINCEAISDTVEACNKCASCVSFNEGRSLNIYELDAASNNSVDDIRALVDQVRYAPQQGRYKVYIIDEVHMLSSGAFNAFLKTLEEPPSHAIFILATTEKQKIIPTILSRCQIFDFSRISVEDITTHLSHIAQKEGVQAEVDALHIIAQKADGALRDALSLFDQLVSFAGNSLGYKQVIENLNILDYDYYFRLTDELIAGDISAALITFNEIVNKGFDGHNFINGLGSHFRDLLVCTDEVTLPLLEVSPSIKEKYKVQSRVCTIPWLLNALEITNTADYRYKAAKHQRLHVELSLIRLCRINHGSTDEKPGVKKKVDTGPAIKSVQQENTNAGAASRSPVVSAPEPVVQKVPEPVTAAHSQAVPAPPKPVGTGNSKKTISISGVLNSRKETQKEVADATVFADAKNAFTEEQLNHVWNLFAEELQKQGRLTLHAALSKRKAILEDNYVIRFSVDSSAIEKDLHEIKPELLAYLRKKLENYSIKLETELVSGEENGSIPYTPSEKFKKLAEINPLLNKMKTQFDLEIEY